VAKDSVALDKVAKSIIGENDQASVVDSEFSTEISRLAGKVKTSAPTGIVNLPQPEYPRFCRRRGQEGRVVVRVFLASDGTVSAVKIIASSGFSKLDRAALAAVKHGQFSPAKILGVSVKSHKDVAFTFRLGGCKR
jgi:protein TonB